MARTLDLAKRAAILAAAKSIFIRDGYAATKMSDIASESNVAQGTLYLYYESKEALASAVGAEFFTQLFTKFASIIRKIEDPDGVEELVDFALKVGDEERDVLAMAREHTAAHRKPKEVREQLLSELTQSITDCKNRGIIRNYSDTRILTELILAVLRRALMSRAIFGDESTEQLRVGAILMLQHALFDDVTLAANQLVKRKSRIK